MLYSSYNLAWLAYLTGCFFIVLSLSTLIWSLPKKWVFALMSITAAILLVPIQLETQDHWYAPAILAFGIDFFLQKSGFWKEALSHIVIACFVALIAYFIVLFLFKLKDTALSSEEEHNHASPQETHSN